MRVQFRAPEIPSCPPQRSKAVASICFPTFVNFVCTVDNAYEANDDLDRQLVRRFLDGERDAGDELVNRFHRSLFNVALRMLGNVQDAEDVTQTVFGNAFAALDSYDPKYRFFSWIYRMTVNESLNTLKRRRNMSRSTGASMSRRTTPRPRARPMRRTGSQAPSSS